MAERYQIDVNVSARGAAGGSGSRSSASAAVSEMLAADRRKVEAGKDPTKKGNSAESARDRVMADLSRSIPKLTQAIQRLERQVASGGGRGGVGTPGGIPRGGAGAPAGGGQQGSGLGAIGSAIPFIGAAIAALGFVTNKVLNIGRNWMQYASAQKGTAGTGGFFDFGHGMYSGAEMGQYASSRMRAQGSDIGAFSQHNYWNSNWKKENGKWVDKGWMGNRHFDKMRTQDSARGYADVFGVGASELGRMQGTFDFFGGGGMSGIISKYGGGRSGGISGGLPTMLQAIADTLSDAVRTGVNDSDIAEGMARELTTMARFTPSGRIEGVTGLQKSAIGVQGEISRGQISGAWGYETFKAGRSVLRSGLMDPNSKMAQQMIAAGVLSKDQIDKVRSGGHLGTYSEQAAIQFLMANKNADVRGEAMRQIAAPFMKGIRPGTTQEKEMRGRFIANLQSVTGGNVDVMEAGAWWGKQLEDREFGDLQNRAKGGWLTAEEQARYTSLQKSRAPIGVSAGTMAGVRGNLSSAAAAQANLNLRERTQLQIGPAAMQTVMAFDNAMSNLAKTMAPTINEAMPHLTNTIESLGKTAVNVTRELLPALKAVNEFLTRASQHGLVKSGLMSVGLMNTPEQNKREAEIMKYMDLIKKRKKGFEGMKMIRNYIDEKMSKKDVQKIIPEMK